MSRIARKPLEIPTGVNVKQDGLMIDIKGQNGKFRFRVHESVAVVIDGNVIYVSIQKGCEKTTAMLGTTRVLLDNMITGVQKGFERKLQLTGVGYRVKVQRNILDLSLGFSYPVKFKAPHGITVETPSNVEILIKGISKEQVGQVAAEIRNLRPPECYRGKGIRYVGEQVILKETKKK